MEPASDDDFWIHHILEKGLIVAMAPRIKANKLAAKFRPISEKPWVMELSGRALSLAFDIQNFAEGRAKRNTSLRFRALIYGGVTNIRSLEHFDAWLTPKEDDPAHSDLTYYGPLVEDDTTGSGAISQDVVRTLANILSVCEPNDLATVEALRPPR